MTLEAAREKVRKYGQEHVLKYYDELTGEEQKDLLDQIELTDMEVLKVTRDKDQLTERGEFSPLPTMKLDEIEANREHFTRTGMNAIRQGKVGLVLLAGGMGTRLGSDDPKVMFNVGITHDLYIFECQMNNLMEVVNEAGCWIHLFIMTSDKNYDATVDFLTQKNFFGYDAAHVHFFKQGMSATTDYNGKIYMESKGKLSISPNGNGGWFSSLKRSGLLGLIHEEGIEWLNIYGVDNVLQRIADPCFIGATIEKNRAVGAKVVRKNAPREGVGVVCLEDGKPSIVEYYDLTDEMVEAKDENGEPAYNYGVILNYLFNLRAVENMMPGLPLHLVVKKIPYLDDDGNLVKPQAPNGYKYETLVLDMIHKLESCLPYEVEREREFAPIKNLTGVDSVESARVLLEKNGVKM